ncbi:MAG: ABC transporter ATP-binding protein [Alphaproteobacteria bacterium]|nr:ABC transporter ATP-binding protein [Alphaproteobacteria bacterium]
MSTAVVELKSLEKVFRRHRVLDRLSLDIHPGDRIALVGSNGAGKTTMIRCILGQYRHGGGVRVRGMDPHAARKEVLQHVGFVPQMPPPLRMPVQELLRYSANLVGVDPSRMTAIAEAMGLDLGEAARKPFSKLSGGQKQKLLIGIALGRDADLLIMDEPTANLDPAARQILFDLLAERLDSGMIISSHRLEEVAPLVNRVVEMDRGQVVLDDKVEDMVDPSVRQGCRLKISGRDEAFANAIREWGFESADGLEWTGVVAGPDRLKFLGVLSRYAGRLSAIHMDEGNDR